jgi:hypothetical protein
MYVEGTVRPPTQADMGRRMLPLEILRVEHGVLCYPPDDPNDRYPGLHVEYGCEWRYHVQEAGVVSTRDLLALHTAYEIPYDAVVCSIGYEGELGLTWEHLEQCAECLLWHPTGAGAAHAASGEHAARVAEMQRRTATLKERAEATFWQATAH